MPLSSLLEKLRGLFTPAFLIASVTPLFCFILVNLAIFGQFSRKVHDGISSYFLKNTAEESVIAAILAIALIVTAYILSTLNLTLRQILEGEWLAKRMREFLVRRQTYRLDKLLNDFLRLREERRRLSRETASWRDELLKARRQGVTTGKCAYPKDDPTRSAFVALGSLRWRGDSLNLDQLEEAKGKLRDTLLTNSAELSKSEDSRRLDRDHQGIFTLLDYAGQRLEQDYIRLFNEKEFNFSRFSVAPTRMGNIAASVESYAQDRYRMNLVFFWTRLQKILESKTDFYKVLQDAKTQLDFTVSLFWLTVLSTVVWLVFLPFLSRTWLPFIAVWLFGPLLARLWYLVAIQNYRSFADLLRTSLDLFRFELLTDLKLPLPDTRDAELELWERLTRRITYGEDVLIAYKHD